MAKTRKRFEKKPAFTGRIGNRPETGELVASLGQWELWVVSRTKFDWWQNGRAEWLPLKVISTQPQAKKANYSLAISAERFCENDDFALLCDTLPELLPWLETQRALLVARHVAPSQDDSSALGSRAKTIVEIISAKQPIDYTSLFDRIMKILMINQRTVSLELSSLIEQGIVIRERVGYAVQFRLNDEIAA
jgi:DNA-binding transcriptional ArsR family regulator